MYKWDSLDFECMGVQCEFLKGFLKWSIVIFGVTLFEDKIFVLAKLIRFMYLLHICHS